MSDVSTSSSGRSRRTVTAFFDTQAMAQKATDDLVAEGVPEADIRITRGAGTTAVEEKPEATEHKGFWAELKDLFLPDEDRDSYAEGLARGGHLLSVQVDEGRYARVLDILDTDGAVDLDAREAEWRAGGWSGISAGLKSPPSTAQSAQAAPAIESAASAPSTEPATASSLAAASIPATGQDNAGLIGTRDFSHGRTRLRSYTLDGSPVGTPAADARPSGTASAPQALIDRIAAHMDVVASDGATIGTVDHLEGPDRIKLTRSASPDGQHHFIPVAWVERVDEHVHLDRTAPEAKSAW